VPRPARMAQIPKLMARLQFGLQFNTVPRRPGQTDQGRWSSLNRSGQRRPELLMLLGSRAVQALAVCCQYCCQAAGHGLSRTDNSGASAQHMTGNGRSWTICPLLWIRRLGFEPALREKVGTVAVANRSRGLRNSYAQPDHEIVTYGWTVRGTRVPSSASKAIPPSTVVEVPE
jgi:hypothetical protein